MKHQEYSAKKSPEIRTAESESPSVVEKDEALLFFVPFFTITKTEMNQIHKNKILVGYIFVHP